MEKGVSLPLFLYAKVFVLYVYFTSITTFHTSGIYVQKEDLKTVANALHELGLNREEAAKVVREAVKEANSAENLSKKRDNSLLIKVGLLLIAFPDPTISDLAGTLLVSAGLIQNRIKHSTLHLEDVPDTFQGIIKNLQTVRKEG